MTATTSNPAASNLRPADDRRATLQGRFLAERARMRRQDCNLTAREVSAHLGAHYSTFNSWERRLPSRRLELESDWEQVLGVPEGWLRDPQMEPRLNLVQPDSLDQDMRVSRSANAHDASRSQLTSELRALCLLASAGDKERENQLCARYGLGGPVARLPEGECIGDAGPDNAVLQKIRASWTTAPATPALDALVAAIEPRLPAQISILDQALRTMLGPSLSVIDVERLYREILGRVMFVVRDGDAGQVAMPPSFDYSQLERLRALVLEMVRIVGAAHINLVTSMMYQRGDVRHSDITRWLPALPGFEWLEEPSGWFWLGATPPNYIRTMLRKKMSVARNRLEIDRIRAAIARDVQHAHLLATAGIGYVQLPPSIMGEVLSRLPECVRQIRQNTVRARFRIAVEQVLDARELATFHALQSHDGVARSVDLIFGIMQRLDCTAPEAWTVLNTSPIAFEVVDDVYQLCCTFMDPDAYDRALRGRALPV